MAIDAGKDLSARLPGERNPQITPQPLPAAAAQPDTTTPNPGGGAPMVSVFTPPQGVPTPPVPPPPSQIFGGGGITPGSTAARPFQSPAFAQNRQVGPARFGPGAPLAGGGASAAFSPFANAPSSDADLARLIAQLAASRQQGA